MASLIRSGVAERLPLRRVQVGPGAGGLAAGGLEDMLQQCLQTQVTVGVLLGPPRPNRKPVLQVFGAAGRSVAFVKVGLDPLTSDLVRREAEGLRRVLAAGLHVVEPPQLLHAGRVQELDLLVLAPLGSSQQPGRDIDAAPPLEAMAEVAGSQGTRTEVLSSSQFWVDTVHAAGEIPDPALRGRIDGVLDRFAARYGSSNVVMGSWHGDWAPWNMGTATDRVQVWDWERYSDGVPWGLDVAHFLSQRVRHVSPSRAAQEQVLLRDLPDTLRRCGQQGRDQDPTIVLLAYLVTIGLRFASAAGGSAPGRPNPRAEWAIALAERVLAEGGSR